MKKRNGSDRGSRIQSRVLPSAARQVSSARVEGLERRRLFASTLLPWPGVNELVYDGVNDVLYGGGSNALFRFSGSSGTTLSTFAAGGSNLYAIDVSADGRAIYAADSLAPRVRKIDTATEALSDILYTPQGGESNAFDVTILSNSTGLLTTQYSGSGWIPLRRIELSNDSLALVNPNVSVDMNTQLDRAADRSIGFSRRRTVRKGRSACSIPLAARSSAGSSPAGSAARRPAPSVATGDTRRSRSRAGTFSIGTSRP